jgi:hypothetical protein
MFFGVRSLPIPPCPQKNHTEHRRDSASCLSAPEHRRDSASCLSAPEHCRDNASCLSALGQGKSEIDIPEPPWARLIQGGLLYF